MVGNLLETFEKLLRSKHSGRRTAGCFCLAQAKSHRHRLRVGTVDLATVLAHDVTDEIDELIQHRRHALWGHLLAGLQDSAQLRAQHDGMRGIASCSLQLRLALCHGWVSIHKAPSGGNQATIAPFLEAAPHIVVDALRQLLRESSDPDIDRNSHVEMLIRLRASSSQTT